MLLNIQTDTAKESSVGFFDNALNQKGSIASVNTKSVLATLDLNNPKKPTSYFYENWNNPNFEIDTDFNINEYHNHPFISSSQFTKNKFLTELEIKHNSLEAIKKKKQEQLNKNKAVQKGSSIHDLIEKIIKKGIKYGIPLIDFLEKYEVVPKFKTHTKDGSEKALEWYETKMNTDVIAAFKSAAVGEGTEHKQRLKVIELANKSNGFFIQKDLFDSLQSLIKELNRLPYLQNLLKYGVSECSFLNTVNRERIRPDVIVPSEVFGKLLHVSIKTTHDIQRFKSSFYRQGYDIQEGMYNQQIHLALEEEPVSVFFIIECKPSGLVQIKLEEPSKQSLTRWCSRYELEIERYREILKSNSLTGYEGIYTQNKFGIEVI